MHVKMSSCDVDESNALNVQVRIIGDINTGKSSLYDRFLVRHYQFFDIYILSMFRDISGGTGRKYDWEQINMRNNN